MFKLVDRMLKLFFTVL